METIPVRHQVGVIAGNSLPLILKRGDWVDIPVDPRDPWDESRIVRVHVSNLPGLVGSLSDVLDGVKP